MVVEVRANALLVLVPKFGMRATLRFRNKEGKLLFPPLAATAEATPSPVTAVTADPEAHSLAITTDAGAIQLGLFDRLRVQIQVSETRSHLPALRVSLVSINFRNSAKSNETPAITEKVSIRDVVLRSEATAANPIAALPPELMPYRQTPENDSLYLMFQRFRELRLTDTAVGEA